VLSNDKFATLLTIIATMRQIQGQTSNHFKEVCLGVTHAKKAWVGLSTISFSVNPKVFEGLKRKKYTITTPNAARSANLVLSFPGTRNLIHTQPHHSKK
jgi:hypothetical protein